MMSRSQLRIPTRLADRNRPPPRFGGGPPPSPPPPPPPTREEITPSSGWREDSNSHYLLLQLPDFKQEEIKMQIKGDGLNISGERKAGDKIIFFDKIYTVPDNADVERTGFKLDGDTFTATVPKRLLPPPPAPPSPVEDHVKETLSSEDANLSSDIGDLETASDGYHEDEKLKDQQQQQQQELKHETSADDLNKLHSDGEDEKQLKDISDHEEDEKKLKDISDHEEDEKLQYHQQEINEKESSNSVEEEKQKQRGYSNDQKNQFNSAAKMICKSKNTIFISLIAFCLGVLVSRRMAH